MALNSERGALVVLLVQVALVRLSLGALSDLPECGEPYQQNQGYSYTLVGDAEIKYWSNCRFPNPVFDQASCGRIYDRTQKYFLCDPDGLVPEAESSTIDQALYQFSQDSPFQCTNEFSVNENFTILATVVQNIQVPDMETNETCVNYCKELYPVLDETARAATEEEQTLAIEAFAEGLLYNHGNQDCNNYIVVVYWAGADKMHIALGSSAQEKITPELLTVVENITMDFFLADNYEAGFAYLAQEFEAVLVGFMTPALILLFIQGGVLLLLTVLFIVKATSNISIGGHFDDGTCAVVTKNVFYVLSGVFFIEQLLLTMVKIEMKMKTWHLVVPLVLFCIGMVGVAYFITTSNAGDDLSTNSTDTIAV